MRAYICISLCWAVAWTAGARAEITFLNNIQNSFSTPTGVDVAPDGTVYATSLGNGSVRVMEPDGTSIRSLFVPSPRDVAVSPALLQAIGEATTRPIFVVDVKGHRIRRLSDLATLTIGGFGTDPGELNNPLGIDANQIGDIFVADEANHRIQRFDINGNFQSTFGVQGANLGELDAPTDVAIGLFDEIFVADRNNNRVQKFDNDGNFEFAIGGFNAPTSLAISEANHLYVADRDNHRIQRFGTDGALQLSFGSQGNGGNQFNAPLGVAVSSSGLVYVADSGNNRVVRYFDSEAWIRGRNEFSNRSKGPINVGVGSEALFSREVFDRVFLGKDYTLGPLMELEVGSNIRIAEDGALSLAGGELNTDSLQVEGQFIFESGRLTIGSHGITLGDNGPFGDALRIGAQSKLTLGDVLEIGESQNARLEIQAGGFVQNARARIAAIDGVVASAVVSGFGSTWTNTSSLSIGEGGRGALQIQDGGVVASLSAEMGKLADARGDAVISGFHSRWTIHESLKVGVAGQGNITVGNGGHLIAESLSLGVAETSHGAAAISGLGTLLAVGTSISVGDAGRGSLLVESGASVVSQNGDVGTDTGQGNVSLVGVGSNWSIADQLSVGRFGQLDLDPGSSVDVGGDLSVASGGSIGTRGLLAVTGKAAVESGGDLLIDQGKLAANQLNVQSDALLRIFQGELEIQKAFLNAGTFQLAGSRQSRVQSESFQNTGLVLGGAEFTAGIANAEQGEIRLAAGQRLTGLGSSNVNRGRVELHGGELDLDGAFTNAASGLLVGRGNLRAGQGILNEGLVIFSGGESDIHGAVHQTNRDARILSTGGGTITFFDDVQLDAGEIRVSEGSFLVFLGAFNGSMTGTGTSIVEGVLSPGNSPAAVHFQGDLILSETSKSIIELGGAEPGTQYDQVTTAGRIQLGGDLQIRTLPGFDGPEQGEAINFVLFSSESGRQGRFSSVSYNNKRISTPSSEDGLTEHLGGGRFRTFAYSEFDVTLTEYLALPGDTDGDREVGFADFLVLSRNFGTRGDWLAGDFTGDGRVQFRDFLLLSENFGETARLVASVPESYLCPSLLIFLTLLAHRRRRAAIVEHLS